MIVVLFGPPAAGKGTQAKRIHERYGLAHLSTGDMLRAAMEAGTEVGKKAQPIVDSGKLVPDEIMIDLIAERTAMPDCKKGFVLDGFPRTVAQAKALDAMLAGKNQSVGHVVVMDVDQAQLTKRVENRVAETLARGEAVRKDDDLDTFKRRLGVYNDQTAPILPYYQGQGKIRRVDGMQTIDQVTAQIDKVLGGQKAGKP